MRSSSAAKSVGEEVGRSSSLGWALTSSSRAWWGAGELGGAKVSGGEIEQGDGGGVGGDVERAEEVVLLLAEGGVKRGAGGEDAGDLAADDLFGELGVFHLLTDGDAEAFAQESLEVALGGVVGDAAHGHGALAVAGGEGDLQLAAGDDGVVVEELVKVAHAEEDEGVGVLAFGGHELLHDGGEGGFVGEAGGFGLRRGVLEGGVRVWGQLGAEQGFELGIVLDRVWAPSGIVDKSIAQGAVGDRRESVPGAGWRAEGWLGG